MTIYLLRHTTPDIAKGICYGQSDIGLSDTFALELESVKSALKQVDYDMIVTSPLRRCKTLAEALRKQDVVLTRDNRLMEMNFGQWELQPWDDIANDEDSEDWFDDFVRVPVPNGESFLDVHDRMQDFLLDLKSEQLLKTPLIVTHAGNIRATFAIANHVDLAGTFDIAVPYGSINTFEI